MRNEYGLLAGKSERKTPVRYLGVGKRIILKRILNQKICEDCIYQCMVIENLTGFCENCNELLRNCKFSKKDTGRSSKTAFQLRFCLIK
jgi:hypothetical protein